MIVETSELAEHMNLDEGSDYGVLIRLAEAAQNHVERLLGFKIEDEFEEDDRPPALCQAVMMLAAHWYENREASVTGVAMMAIPMGVQDIVAEYRNYTYG